MPRELLFRFLSMISVACFWALDLVVARLAFRSDGDIFRHLFVGLAFAQLSLLTAWLVLHRGRLAEKFILTVLAAAVLTQPLSILNAVSAGLLWSVLAAALLLVATGLYVLGRYDWIPLPGADWTPERPRGQTSLNGIFALTTSVAIAVTALRFAQRPAIADIIPYFILALQFVAWWSLFMPSRTRIAVLVWTVCQASSITVCRLASIGPTIVVSTIGLIGIVAVAAHVLRIVEHRRSVAIVN